MLTKRGALIVFEGCDKAGKSTHVRMLAEFLKTRGTDVQLMNFPDRTTAIGKIIDDYLQKKIELPDESIHLLFSANRWELVPKIRQAMDNGTIVLVDRYAYSGIAFSAAKGLDFNWCRLPDVGLPKPDAVLFLHVDQGEASQRGDYGRERYENVSFQEKVKKMFMALKDDSYWKMVETNRPIDNVHEDCQKIVLETIQRCQQEPIESLWTKGSTLINGNGSISTAV